MGRTPVEELFQRYRRRYDYVLTDESQDTSLVQYAIIEKLVREHGNLCVVADDDQSIYSWRGAEPSYLLINKIKKVVGFLAIGGFILLGVNTIYYSFSERLLVQISPFGTIHLAGDENKINHVFVSDRRSDYWNYAILTDKKEEIEALFNDLEWTWNTNLKSVPKDEGTEIYSVINNKRRFFLPK
ncbi:UvrD-helicase domain-containing protein [Ammoniphilus sp. 3BR4]|uniref:UvrD-helicase domain-containing protein n=1 Tax=Ammoniphilus sp. 3BR4 TaxID=3158265 RepID=UPI003465CAE5